MVSLPSLQEMVCQEMVCLLSGHKLKTPLRAMIHQNTLVLPHSWPISPLGVPGQKKQLHACRAPSPRLFYHVPASSVFSNFGSDIGFRPESPTRFIVIQAPELGKCAILSKLSRSAGPSQAHVSIPLIVPLGMGLNAQGRPRREDSQSSKEMSFWKMEAMSEREILSCSCTSNSPACPISILHPAPSERVGANSNIHEVLFPELTLQLHLCRVRTVGRAFEARISHPLAFNSRFRAPFNCTSRTKTVRTPGRSPREVHAISDARARHSTARAPCMCFGRNHVFQIPPQHAMTCPVPCALLCSVHRPPKSVAPTI